MNYKTVIVLSCISVLFLFDGCITNYEHLINRSKNYEFHYFDDWDVSAEHPSTKIERYESIEQIKDLLKSKEESNEIFAELCDGGVLSDAILVPRGLYVIENDINIATTGILAIESGTTFKFKEDTGIICQGAIVADGSADAYITITALDETKRWNNLTFIGEQSSKSVLKFCKISFGSGVNHESEILFSYFKKVRDYWGHFWRDGASNKNQNKILKMGDEFYWGDETTEFDEEEYEKLLKKAIIEEAKNTYRGGGLYCIDFASIKIDNCIVRNNEIKSYMGKGGGVYFSFSTSPFINNCTILNNYANSGGGLGCFCSSPYMFQSKFIRNVSNSDGNSLYVHDSNFLKISNCLFSDNKFSETEDLKNFYPLASDSSSLSINHSNLVMFSNSNIINNAGHIISHESKILLDNCELQNNVLGGIKAVGSILSLINCNISKNLGFGVECLVSKVKIQNCVISENKAYFGGGGIFFYTYGYDKEIPKNLLIIVNSIISKNDSSREADFQRDDPWYKEFNKVGAGVYICSERYKIYIIESDISENEPENIKFEKDSSQYNN